MEEEKCSRITIRVKPEIKQQLQIMAIKKQSTMNEIITNLIIDYLNNRK